ncbi:ABC transporter ATP-binding protein [Mesorhizobium sp. M7A.F.Ca.US.006.01.1.1]|uniref:ABC transporter ATP-binding protein n=1 Tax=Mesorhizobium sp. M7A.F.Ca.US.006.01.1.1 TaxID=2496707 RepID=UPI000FCA1E15|nr:ABC transporter ATP-binding protein [Mesorhizobium sp. M7A.F.Ca.US.006.01.1.1]RUZ73481.1 ABC transporter ATP-binding protein [Mesorhizobium sp. M7A.F.Ca.US.006.01.1.1]
MSNVDRISREPSSTVLEIRGLRIEAKGDDRWQEIVKGVDLSLKRGEVLGLIGESGAGKSTIGLAAMGYARPGCRIASGTITFDGKDLTQCGDRELRSIWGARIAYVAQSAAASFNPAHRLIDQYVEAALSHQAGTRREAEKAAIQLFERLHLPSPKTFGLRYPHQVSGGQLQRAMTAMAMACRPDIIIFDEPTTALDVTTQIEVLASIKEVVKQFHTAAIYISHDLAVVAQIADRVMVLRHGLVVEQSSTRSMLADPKEAYTKSLWAVRSLFKEESRTSDSLLTVNDVSVSYGSVKALESVSINVPRGTTVALVGESGSGKSTLARAISGLQALDAGTIAFDGKPLPASYRDREKSLLQSIQMIYQIPDTALNPRRRIGDILGRPLEFHLGLRGAAKRRRIGELLDMIELNGRFLDRLPGELSGGQMQRICIARALAVNPKLIICDEVTSALDQLVAGEILKLLLKLQKELQMSYLYITHDISTVRAIADDVVVMHRGRVVESGPKSEVLDAPRNAYTVELLSSVPEMDPDWLNKKLTGRKIVFAA